MKEIIRRSAVNALSLFLVSLLFSGLIVRGGFSTYIYAGILLSILSIIIDPVVKIVTLPFNLLTLGLLSFLSTLVSLLVLTYFYHNIAIASFIFQGITFLGIHINRIYISGILSIVAVSATIYLLGRFLSWIFER